MIRRLLLVLICSVAAFASAAEPGASTLAADRSVVDLATGESVLSGNAELRDGDLLLRADEFRYKGSLGRETPGLPQIITARGNVVYTRGVLRALADEIVVNRTDGTFTATRIRLGQFPYYVSGDSASGTQHEITVRNATLSYGEPGPWQPTARAPEVIVAPSGRRIRASHVQVGIGQVQPLPFPRIQQSLSDPVWSMVDVTGGFRRSLGAFIDAGLSAPVAPGVRLGANVGYYSARGVLAGPSGSYADATDPEKLRGRFRGGYINDHGDKKTDVLGAPVPEDRAFVEWEHRQKIGANLHFAGQLNWWSDSEIIRDFRPRAFFPVQQPDTYLEANAVSPNSIASAFARFSPNSFQVVQQRTPELRLDVLPIAAGNGFYQRFNLSAVVLREETIAAGVTTVAPVAARPSASWTTTPPFLHPLPDDLRSNRFDAYYSLARPFNHRDWLTFTPVVGARLTGWTHAGASYGTGSHTRALGEAGFDALVRTHGTFDYRNERWNIHGLRHLFTPRLSYRYIQGSARGPGRPPLIDRHIFSTYLQPLGLGDQRNVDEIRETNTFRLSFDNVLQTRDPKSGPRDLLAFNVASDFRLDRTPGERTMSAVHTEFAAMPARWLEVGFYNSFDPHSFTLREFDSGVTIRDGHVWSVRFANSFLKGQLYDYHLDGRVRLNERFDALAVLRYDQRKRRFTEQTYGVVQSLGNTWRISYLVSLYSGRRRESSFGFSVQVDTVRF